MTLLCRCLAVRRLQVFGFRAGLRHISQMAQPQWKLYQTNGFVKIPRAFSSVEMQNFKGCVEEEPSSDRVFNKISELIEQRGSTLYDDFSTQLEHARVTAYMAMKNHASTHTIVAAFLHDIGHLLLNEHSGRGDFLADDKLHEDIGARFLSRVFPPEVTEVVRLHVDAKRYLCRVDQEYHDGLSEMSQRSLVLQGGPLSESEAVDWAAQPFAQQAAQIRKWEDEGKRLWRDGKVTIADLPHTEELMELVRRAAFHARPEA